MRQAVLLWFGDVSDVWTQEREKLQILITLVTDNRWQQQGWGGWGVNDIIASSSSPVTNNAVTNTQSTNANNKSRETVVKRRAS